MHLGMSGSLSFAAGLADPGAHDHFDLVTARGTLRLTDPRRFGAVVWSPASISRRPPHCWPASASSLSTPRFTGEHLHAALARSARRRQDRAARRAHRRRRRQHLRLRGPVRGRHRSAHAQRPAQPAALRARSPTPSAARWHARSTAAARPCATSATRTAWPGVPAHRAGLWPGGRAVPALRRRPSGASSRASGRRSSVRVANVAESLRAAAVRRSNCTLATGVTSCIPRCLRGSLRYHALPSVTRGVHGAFFRSQSRCARRLAHGSGTPRR